MFSVFLSAIHEDPKQRRVCYVQTAQLDGETNLKVRNTPEQGDIKVHERLSDDASFASFNGFVKCEEPTEDFTKFQGMLYFDRNDDSGVSLSAENLLLRVSRASC